MIHKQKLIIASLLAVSAISWILSFATSDMMMHKLMITMTLDYDILKISLFTIIWALGMIAMMFPAIIPMILLYNKLIAQKEKSDTVLITKEKKTAYSPLTVLFTSTYIVIWTLVGLLLYFGWSLSINNFIVNHLSNDGINSLFGIILIISGMYQFSSIKKKCLGYCESPLIFFTKRWQNGITGAIKMGTYHGLYCLGCCWPYFLLMMSLGWMSILWMGFFAAIIFVEKIWSKGILISRVTGIGFVTLGILSVVGIITLYDGTMSNMNMNGMN